MEKLRNKQLPVLSIFAERELLFILIISIFIGINFSCNPTKKVVNGEYLLKKYKIEIDADKKTEKFINTDELNNYIKGKPNKKIFRTFRFHLGLYNLSKTEKNNSFHNWLRRIGEAPVILDTNIVNRNTRQLSLALNNQGFYNAVVEDSVDFGIPRKKKAKVYYKIIPNTPYFIKNVDYDINDSSVFEIIKSESENSIIKVGEPINASKLDKERLRLTNILRNNGYYYFSKNNIGYDLDSALNSSQVNIVLKVYNPETTIDSTNARIITKHKKYFLNNIYVYVDYNPKSLSVPDTMFVGGYHFLYYDEEIKYDPNILKRSIYFNSNEIYKLNNVNQTYGRLSDLKVFKFTDIQFVEENRDLSNNQLNCHIFLSDLPSQSFSVEMEATHSSGDLGIVGNLTYQNRNVFGGAEILNVRLKGGLEVQNSVQDETDAPFNTIEVGPEVSLRIPKFMLIPINEDSFSKRTQPKTIFTASYNYQRRPDYVRDLTLLSYGYTFNNTRFKTHMLNPFELNLIKIEKEQLFSDRIFASNDPYIINLYSNHLITNILYSYTFNNQSRTKSINHSYFNGNIEFSGFGLGFISKNVFSVEPDSLGRFSVLDIVYSQYIKPELDYRRYHFITPENLIAFRIMTGVGLPFRNSNSLPFEKSYFGGGANDIRAWNARLLGPGGHSDSITQNFDKTGDIKLISSLEYRFPIFSYLKGALFVDAGNIWLFKENEEKPNSNFDFETFVDQIAVGAGLGARLDFSFFVIRLDAAIPIHNPAKIETQRWINNNAKIKDVVLNLGIGFPF